MIRYPAEDAVLVPYARDTLEAAYKALHDDLGLRRRAAIRVELYRSPSDLAAVSSLSQAEVARTGTIALCKWARLMVTTPRALAYGYPWLDSINHELVHYAVSTLTGDRAPVWLQEGLAKFLERRWREPAGRPHPAGDGAPAGQGAALGQADHLRCDAPLDGEAAVGRGRDAGVRRGGERDRLPARSRAGWRRCATRSSASAAGDDARPAVAAAAGGRWPEFERGWRAFMVAQHSRRSRRSTSRRRTSASRPRSRRGASRRRGRAVVGRSKAARRSATCGSATCC